MRDPRSARALRRGGGLVTAGLTTVNLTGYLLAVLAARRLGPAAYGELTALLGGLLVACVPALAAQAVVARTMARRPVGEPVGPRERALLGRCTAVAGALTVAGLVLAPLFAAFVHTGIAGPLWVAAQLGPFVLLSAVMGLLQGAQRFTALAVVLGAQGLGKVVGLAPLLLHGGPADVLAGLGLGTVGAMVVALLLLGRGAAGPAPRDLPGRRELTTAVGGLLALLVLANLDLLVARHLLPAGETGRYSVGLVLAKASFWLPQGLVVVLYPRLTDPVASAAVLRRAVAVVAALGLLELGGALLLAGPVLRLVFGAPYASLGGLAPLWVVQGTALAVVQLVVYASIASRDRSTGRLIAGACVVEAVVLIATRPTTVAPVITLATTLAVVLGLTLLLRSGGLRANQCPAASQVRPTPTLTSSGTDSG